MTETMIEKHSRRHWTAVALTAIWVFSRVRFSSVGSASAVSIKPLTTDDVVDAFHDIMARLKKGDEQRGGD